MLLLYQTFNKPVEKKKQIRFCLGHMAFLITMAFLSSLSWSRILTSLYAVMGVSTLKELAFRMEANILAWPVMLLEALTKRPLWMCMVRHTPPLSAFPNHVQSWLCSFKPQNSGPLVMRSGYLS